MTIEGTMTSDPGSVPTQGSNQRTLSGERRHATSSAFLVEHVLRPEPVTLGVLHRLAPKTCRNLGTEEGAPRRTAAP